MNPLVDRLASGGFRADDTLMLSVFKQWIARAVSLCVVGPICSAIIGSVVAVDGSHHTTFLTGHNLGSGIGALAMVLGLSLVMGVVIGRVVDRREGILNIAFVFGWVAWTSGRLGELYRVAPESSTLIKLSAEGFVISAMVIVALVLMTDPKKGAANGQVDDVSRFDLAWMKTSLGKAEGMVSMGAALVASLVVSYLFGQTDLPGQSVGVGFGAGIAAGLGGALAANSARKNDEKDGSTAFAPIMIGVMLSSVLLPLIGLIKPGAGGLVELVVSGSLPGYLIVSPMAWSMGALMGVPIGHSWVEHSVQQAGEAQAA